RLSPYHFCRSFKHSFGMPPHRYHANRRIEQAKRLLANRELSVTAIALDVGFSETSTFTAAFHRLTGQTPSGYRRNLDSTSRVFRAGRGQVGPCLTDEAHRPLPERRPYVSRYAGARTLHQRSLRQTLQVESSYL